MLKLESNLESVISMNNKYLNNFFSKRNLNGWLENKDELPSTEVIAKIKNNYQSLNKNYRNEFFYKNTLFNKILLGKFSLSTSVAFSEITVGKSKADFVVINHNQGIVYEIKTDLDNLDRLVYQLEDYSQVFASVFVVTSEKNFYPVYKVLREAELSAGILVLTERGSLSLRKPLNIDNSRLNHIALFKMLRKHEYESILMDKYGSLPMVKQVEYYKACLHVFKTIEIDESQKLVFSELKKRNVFSNSELLKQIPYEIRWLVYQSNLREEDVKNILQFFEKD